MVTTAAVLHGDRARLLRFHEDEHPVALQLGGSDPKDLAQAARIGAEVGYDAINLNVGCPSDRVQSGAFGAVLMASGELVRDCVAAMRDAVDVPVTVKCRIGVDDQVPEDILPAFLETVAQSGVTEFTIHARMAWLQGLSPKENRDIPPLNYPLVVAMKDRFPHLNIGINGGITGLDQVASFLDEGLDGVMVGRAAYHDPAGVLMRADSAIFGTDDPVETAEGAVLAMLDYIESELVSGTRLNAITRHMLGLFVGRPGARHWRRHLSETAHKPGSGPDVVLEAMSGIGAAAA